jgi:hypothetical protein
MDPQIKEMTEKTAAGTIEAHSREIIQIGSLVLLVLLIVGGFIFKSATFAFGAFVGGLIAIASYRGIQSSLKSSFAAAAENKKQSVVFKTLFGFFTRLVFAGIVVYLALKSGWADPVAILAGASVVMVNCLIVGVAIMFTHKGA